MFLQACKFRFVSLDLLRLSLFPQACEQICDQTLLQNELAGCAASAFLVRFEGWVPAKSETREERIAVKQKRFTVEQLVAVLKLAEEKLVDSLEGTALLLRDVRRDNLDVESVNH